MSRRSSGVRQRKAGLSRRKTKAATGCNLSPLWRYMLDLQNKQDSSRKSCSPVEIYLPVHGRQCKHSSSSYRQYRRQLAYPGCPQGGQLATHASYSASQSSGHRLAWTVLRVTSADVKSRALTKVVRISNLTNNLGIVRLNILYLQMDPRADKRPGWAVP